MNSNSNDFMYLVRVITEILQARAKGLEARTMQSLGTIKGALCLTILLLLFDQVIILFQKPTISLANSIDSAQKTNSYVGKCNVAKIDLKDDYVLPKEFDIENHNFYLISKFQKRRLFLSWYIYESLDAKYIFYDEFVNKNLLEAYFLGKIPSIRFENESNYPRKLLPIPPYVSVEIDNNQIKDSLKMNIVENFWNKEDVKIIGKIALTCHCNSQL